VATVTFDWTRFATTTAGVILALFILVLVLLVAGIGTLMLLWAFQVLWGVVFG